MPSPALDREAVIAIACDIIDADGHEALTLTRVAEAADVTQPALYRHVDNVNDLWRGVGLAARAELAAACAEACVGRAGTDAVRAVAAAWRAYGQQYPGRYRSTENFPVAGDPELEDAVSRVLEVLCLALRGYRLSDTNVVHGARALRSALHGFVSFEIGDGNPAPPGPDESFEHLIDLLCTAFEQESDAQIPDNREPEGR